MGLLKRLAHVAMRTKAYKATIKLVAEKLPYNNIVAEYHERSISEGSYKRQAVHYQAKEIKDWVTGVMSATDPDNPRRSLLYRFYQNLLTDEHLQTTIDNRVLPLQQASFRIVNQNGEEQEELTKLIEKPWLHELHKLFIMHKLQGPTLVRMSELNDKMELASVEEYPQSNFIAQRGIIINEEYDEKGVSYKEGALANYFVQFGNDWALGMLNELAVIILAKKLGMGSWISYIEKYGVPPIFAITDRLDDKRTQELYDMLSAFQSEHFAVLKGNEKIEFGKDVAGDGKSAFGPLIDYADRKISTRLLGQTGTTSNEAYTGTAFVHERVEETRHNADKLLFMYYFNDLIIPRLVKLSPVYAGLANCKLEWDNAEKLTVTEYIDGIVKLKDQFEFDEEEVRARTGLPITGKVVVTEPTTPSPTPTTKKVSATVEENSLSPVAHITEVTADAFGSIIDKVMQAVYDNQLKKGDVDKDLLVETYNQLNDAAAKGWGKEYTDHEIESASTSQAMRENLFAFSGAKSFQEIEEMNKLMYDDSGEKRPFSEFRKDVLTMHKEYNENYLKTEYDASFASAQQAEKWAGYVADKRVFPNLKYIAVEDDRTRPAHAAMHKVVKPVDDPFWMLNYPPNGWRCRCHVEQTTDDVTDKRDVPNMPIEPAFAHNSGATGEVFGKAHQYFTIPKNVADKVSKNIELQKEYAPYHIDTKSRVMISDFAAQEALTKHLDAARIIDDKLKIKANIRPFIDDQSANNSPFLIKKQLGHYADVDMNNFEKAIKDAKKNECNYAVLSIPTKITKNGSIAGKLTKLAKEGGYDDMNAIIIRGSNAIQIPFKDVLNDKHIDKLKDF